jgi:aspartate kinase
MKVYKFGGASVKDAEGIRNLSEIVSLEKDNLVVVVSAFGKTTNALEKVLRVWRDGSVDYINFLDEVFKNHITIAKELFGDNNSAKAKIDESFDTLKEYLLSEKESEYDFDYDQVVSFGEVWSTIIVAEYLVMIGLNAEWVDIRKNLLTDNRFRDADILWDESTSRIKIVFNFKKAGIFVTQGFIGGTADGDTTTLGREGSDYTAALLANILDAENVVVWKDVPGILNADPKWLPDAHKLDEISGAKVIHPKTIKPLHNKNIPLYVRSFLMPEGAGTVIKTDPVIKEISPVFIRKEDQILLSIVPNDFSFVMGDNLGRIFHSFLLHGIMVNLVEASAVSLDVCVDDDRSRIDKLFSVFKPEFSVVYNENVEMLSIRHYTPSAVKKITEGREILLEQRTRSTVRYVVRKQRY